MPKLTVSRPIVLDGVFRKPTDGEIEVTDAAAARAKAANAVAKLEQKSEPKPAPVAVTPAKAGGQN